MSVRFGLHYDFRNPPQWREPWDRRYPALLEQISWAERELGFDAFSISEHHLVDFATAPLSIAGAIAARTSRARIGTNVVVLPVYHPLRVAEDSLTLDAISGGRFELGVGLGYREDEFRAFGTSLRERRSRMEESLQILRKAFSGERFRFEGEHYRFDEIEVVPGPVRKGGPGLWIGGLSEPGIERAARAGDGYLCPGPEAMDQYVQARRRNGLDAGRVSLLQNWIVDEDPERTFARIGAHALYHFQQYRTFGMPNIPALETPDQLLEYGFCSLLDADGAVDAIQKLISRGPVEQLEFWPVFPGEPVESASARLEYFASKVLTRARASLDPGEAAPAPRVPRLTSHQHEVADYEAAVEMYFERGWTDGLPIVPPTEHSVAAVVETSGRPADDVVGEYPSRRRVVTVEKAAVNAVMAGCKPEYFPVVLALLEALCDEQSNMHVPNATTGGAALGFVINGPVIEQIGLNFRGNVLGPGFRANSTIGRALRLIQINVLGSVPGAGNAEEGRPILDRATLGQPARYAGYHIVENERDFPTLLPLHVERGFDRNESAVTLFSTNGHVQYGLSGARSADETIATLVRYLLGSGRLSAQGFCVVVLPPECAEHLVRADWTKADIRQALFEGTTRTVAWAKREGWGVQGGFGERIGAPVEPGDEERTVAIARSPDDIHVVVSGAPAGAFIHCLFPYGSTPVSKSVRVAI